MAQSVQQFRHTETTLQQKQRIVCTQRRQATGMETEGGKFAVEDYVDCSLVTDRRTHQHRIAA